MCALVLCFGLFYFVCACLGVHLSLASHALAVCTVFMCDIYVLYFCAIFICISVYISIYLTVYSIRMRGSRGTSIHAQVSPARPGRHDKGVDGLTHT